MKPARISPPSLLGIALIAIAVLISSCGSPSIESPQPTSPPESIAPESPAPAESVEATPASPAPITPPEAERPMSDPASLPDQVANQVKTAIAQSANISAEAIQITNAEPHTWPNGCLGLANPDEFCTQALVEGWQVEATNGETTWTYRTDATGSQIRPER